VNALFEHYVEPHLVNPTFVLDYPAALCPLTKRDPGDPQVALRFEVFINGMELGNAYSELNDPEVQRQTLSRQLRGEEGETMAVMDEDFVEALECGMPPAGGLGIGMDRLVMLLIGSPSIRDVILFPLQRPSLAAEALARGLALLTRSGRAVGEPSREDTDSLIPYGKRPPWISVTAQTLAELGDTSIAKLGLSARASRSLRDELGATHVREVLAVSRHDLLQLPSIGPVACDEIEKALRRLAEGAGADK